MKKKTGWIGAGLAVGSLMIVSTAFAGVGGTPGYDTYKEALRQTATQSNETRLVNVTLTDNGSKLLDVRSVIKSDDASDATSAIVEVSGLNGEERYEAYGIGERTVLKSAGSETYYVSDDSEEGETEDREEWKDQATEISQTTENVIDALVGNMKQYFVETPGVGDTSNIRVELTGSRIPAAVNAVGSLLITEMSRYDEEEPKDGEPGDEAFDEWERVVGQLPELSSDVRIDSIVMNAVADPDYGITEHDIAISYSGKDADGKEHTVVLDLALDTTDINSTVPDKIDLTGKNVEVVPDRDND